ncbi:MAG: holo-ACP synthase [Lachnospiraceae bacterium]|nr:holo-ACP synthase [Lachnospiraceae bacterium]
MERIIGIGTDQISCERVKKACESSSFLKKYYSEEEQSLIEKRQSRAATNFAGKEAVSKAFGTGFAGIFPKEIEILRDEKGAPYVQLSGTARKTAENMGIFKIHISLTDTKEYASAFVIAVGRE